MDAADAARPAWQKDQGEERHEKQRARRNAGWGPWWPRGIRTRAGLQGKQESAHVLSGRAAPLSCRDPPFRGRITPSHLPWFVSRSSRSRSRGPGRSGRFWTSGGQETVPGASATGKEPGADSASQRAPDLGPKLLDPTLWGKRVPQAGRHLRNEGHFSRGGLHSRTSGDTLSNHLNASILAGTGEEVHLLTHPLE